LLDAVGNISYCLRDTAMTRDEVEQFKVMYVHRSNNQQ
jgi:hypothetical protein